jgi:2-polyprenyl-3-methyl-5-hydroxy-6-metoxy-1,4-benzoquinol methylase
MMNELPEGRCQLCDNRQLQRFEIKNSSVLWLCEACELYQYGRSFAPRSYDGDYHDGYLRKRSGKVKAAQVRLNRLSNYVADEPVRLLDIGCSVGSTLTAAESRGWMAVGVDYSRQAVDICRSMNLDAKVTSSYELPFEDNSFDVVTSWHVIEHVRDVRETLVEWTRVLRDGGILAIETPDASSPKVRTLGTQYRKFWAATHTYTFTPANLSQFMIESGLQLVSRPFLGPISGYSPPLAAHAFVYQATHALKRRTGIHKAFQLFAIKQRRDGRAESRDAA